MTRYRFQLTGILEQFTDLDIPQITKVLSERVNVPNITITGATVHRMPEPKKRIGKKAL